MSNLFSSVVFPKFVFNKIFPLYKQTTPTNNIEEKSFDTKKTEIKTAPAKEPEKVDTKTPTKPELKKTEPEKKPALKKPEPEPEKKPELKTRADLAKKVTETKKTEPEKPKTPTDKPPELKTPEIIVPEEAERRPVKVDTKFNEIIKILFSVATNTNSSF